MFVVDYTVSEVGKKRKNKLKTDAGEGIGDQKWSKIHQEIYKISRHDLWPIMS